jgi:hypothetical protein
MDVVQLQFDLEDEISLITSDVNDTIINLKIQLTDEFVEEIKTTENLLIVEITKRLNSMNENMKKFSDVSSMSANELRSLFESEIVNLQVIVSDMVAKSKVLEVELINKNTQVTEQFSDMENREVAYQANLLEVANGLELFKSSFSVFKNNLNQQMSGNAEKLDTQSRAVNDVFKSISAVDFKISETKNLQVETSEKLESLTDFVTVNEKKIEEFIKKHASDREHILMQKAHLKKAQDSIDSHSDKLDKIETDLSESLKKSDLINDEISLHSAKIDEQTNEIISLKKKISTNSEMTENMSEEILYKMDQNS